MEWEIEVDEPIKPAWKRKTPFRASIVLRYALEAIVFGFIAGAIGYGIQTATGWDAIVSYVIGIVLVAGVYFIYLTRIMGIEGLR